MSFPIQTLLGSRDSEPLPKTNGLGSRRSSGLCKSWDSVDYLARHEHVQEQIRTLRVSEVDRLGRSFIFLLHWEEQSRRRGEAAFYPCFLTSRKVTTNLMQFFLLLL